MDNITLIYIIVKYIKCLNLYYNLRMNEPKFEDLINHLVREETTPEVQPKDPIIRELGALQHKVIMGQTLTQEEIKRRDELLEQQEERSYQKAA